MWRVLIQTKKNCIFQGQSESKKAAKKLGPETKGTAMSFGFKKKIYSTSKKNGNSIKEKEKLSQEEQFGSINTDNDGGDDNGNRGRSFQNHQLHFIQETGNQNLSIEDCYFF